MKLRLQFPNLRPAEIFDFEGIPLLRSAWFTGVVRAVLVFVALADGMLSLELWTLRSPNARSAASAALQVVAPVRPVVALGLAGLALYLATRPKRAFGRVLLVLAVCAALLSLKSGRQALVVVALLDGFFALMAGSLWPEQGDRLSSRLGWSLLGVAAAAVTLSVWMVLNEHLGPRATPTFTLPLVLGFAAGVLGLIVLDRNPPLPGRWDPDALPIYLASGRSGVSPFTLMRDKLHFWAGDQSSFVAYACRAGVALVLGPAVGPSGASPGVLREFRLTCKRCGWRPAFYQVPAETLADLPGTRRLMIGSEAFVDIESFGLKGRAMANLRHQVTKAQRLGVQVETHAEAEIAWTERSAMGRLSAEAAARSLLGEMSFSVGRWEEPPLVERTVGLAVDSERRLLGYVTWLWVPAAELVVLDEVRRSPQAPAGTIELLIASSLLEFRGRARRASLGLAPFTGARHATGLAVAEAFLRRVIGFRSLSPGLYAFKAKFGPVWEPRYLVAERIADLAPVMVALLLVHYPRLTRRWWSRGRSLLRLS